MGRFFCNFSPPFILAHCTAKPLCHMSNICSKPQYGEISYGWKEIVRPSLGFIFFLLGKVLITISYINNHEFFIPGFTAKPFTVYFCLGIFLLSPLGLQFFLAFQEFVFYMFNHFYGSLVIDLSKKIKRSPQFSGGLQNGEDSSSLRMRSDEDISHSNAEPEMDENFHEEILEISAVMKNLAEMSSPFLLQNLSFMLFYWIIRVYNLFQTVAGIPYWSKISGAPQNSRFLLNV